MDHALNLEIVNDTPFQNLTYILSVDHSAVKTRQTETVLKKNFTSPTKEISVKVRKKDLWKTGKGVSGRFWLFLDALDVCFGSLSDCEHLPFSLDYKDLVDCEKEKKILLLSKMLNANEKSIALWSRYTALKYLLTGALILFIVLLASVIFTGFWRIVWIGGCALLIALMLVFLFGRRNRLKKELLSYASADSQ